MHVVLISQLTFIKKKSQHQRTLVNLNDPSDIRHIWIYENSSDIQTVFSALSEHNNSNVIQIMHMWNCTHKHSHLVVIHLVVITEAHWFYIDFNVNWQFYCGC